LLSTKLGHYYFSKGGRVNTPPIMPRSKPKSIPPKQDLKKSAIYKQNRYYRTTDKVDPPVVNFFRISPPCLIASEKYFDHRKRTGERSKCRLSRVKDYIYTPQRRLSRGKVIT
jgi:hypothetical protein